MKTHINKFSIPIVEKRRSIRKTTRARIATKGPGLHLGGPDRRDSFTKFVKWFNEGKG